MDSIADALHRAFTMAESERRQRIQKLQSVLSRYSATQWAHNFLADLAKVSANRATTRRVRLTPLRESWSEDLRQKIDQATKLSLVLDYDGTLVGLQKRPELALIALETLHLLEQMKNHFEICILSGRSADFLEQQFMGNSFLIGAEHGAFMKLPDGTW